MANQPLSWGFECIKAIGVVPPRAPVAIRTCRATLVDWWSDPAPQHPLGTPPGRRWADDESTTRSGGLNAPREWDTGI